MVYAMDRRATSARGSAGRDTGGAPTSYAGVRATTTRSVQPREFEFSFGDAGGATRAPTHHARATSAASSRPASSFKVRRIPRATATDASPGLARPHSTRPARAQQRSNVVPKTDRSPGPPPSPLLVPSPPRPGAPRVPDGGQTALPDASGDASRDGVRLPHDRHPDRFGRDPRSTTRADPTHQRGPPPRSPPLERVPGPRPHPHPRPRPRPRTRPSSKGVDGARASRASSRVHVHARRVRGDSHRRGVPPSVLARDGTRFQNRRVERKNDGDDARANLPAGDGVVASTPRSSQSRACARFQTPDVVHVRRVDFDFDVDLDANLRLDLASEGSREAFGSREAVHGGRDDVVPRRSRSCATDEWRRDREGGSKPLVSADEPGDDEGRYHRGRSDALLGTGHDRARQGGARVVRVRDAQNHLDGDGDGRGDEPARDGSRDGATRRRIRVETNRVETRRRTRAGRFVRGDASTRADRARRRGFGPFVRGDAYTRRGFVAAAESASPRGRRKYRVVSISVAAASEGCDVCADADARSPATRSFGRIRSTSNDARAIGDGRGRG